ncbi:MAG: hypothetical protein KGL39_33145, partial [Patescibacteria group bacterium]|nr:hypothetical protein [Patescibacteria group bacterium]
TERLAILDGAYIAGFFEHRAPFKNPGMLKKQAFRNLIFLTLKKIQKMISCVGLTCEYFLQIILN